MPPGGPHPIDCRVPLPEHLACSGRNKGPAACRCGPARSTITAGRRYCKPIPDRLFGPSRVAVAVSVDLAIAEIAVWPRRENSGSAVASSGQTNHNNKMIHHHVIYEPLGPPAEDLDSTMSVPRRRFERHTCPTVGGDSFEGPRRTHINLAPRDGRWILACMYESDLGRRLRAVTRKSALAFLRLGGGGAGIEPWSTGWTAISTIQGFNDFPGLTTRPRSLPSQPKLLDLVRARSRASIKADGRFIGPHKILVGDDYPHPTDSSPAPKRSDSWIAWRAVGRKGENQATRSWPAARDGVLG